MTDAATDTPNELTFLGREFLTWLAYHADAREGLFPAAGESPAFSLAFGERVTLRSLTGEIGEMRVRGETPAGSTDVRFAFAGGMTVREADLVARCRGREYRFRLTADRFEVRGARLPTDVDRAPDAERASARDAKVEDRLSRLEDVDSFVERAFGAFLALRRSEAWKDAVADVRDWIAEALSDDVDAGDGEGNAT